MCRLFSCLYSYKLTNVEKKPKWIQDPDQHYDQVFFREQNMSFAKSLKMLREVAKRKRENDDEVPSAGQPGKYRKLTSPVLTSSGQPAAEGGEDLGPVEGGRAGPRRHSSPPAKP